MARQPYLGESLLAPGLIRLFGREFEGLKLGREGIDTPSNNPLGLRQQIDRLAKDLAALRPPAAGDAGAPPAAGGMPPLGPDPDEDPEVAAQQQDGKPRLARIYGFSYLGNYYKSANPPVLRVHGQGFVVKSGFAPDNDMDVLGVEFKDEDFVHGIRMWPADHLDVAVRIDITIGWLREILLDTDMSQETNATGNGGGGRADVVGRDSGLVGRDSGLVGRDSGFVGRSRR
jgi:hypothetical protein